MTGRPCNRCGKCCVNSDYMGTLQASGDDVKRWKAQKRWDILQYAYILGDEDDPFADLWVKKNGDDAERCPFVRKDRGANTYKCMIYDTRPEVCRNYEPWHEGAVCVEIVDNGILPFPPLSSGDSP